MHFNELLGRTITSITGAHIGSDSIEVKLTDGTHLRMYSYNYECGNDVSIRIEDIVGDVKDVIGSPILLAEEASSNETKSTYEEELGWTFYKLSTIKGNVTIRWTGRSNGYYSCAVTIDVL